MEDIEQTTPEEEGKNKKVQKTVLSYLHDLVFGLVAVLLLFMLVFRVITVSGSSMYPTLIGADDGNPTLQSGDCLLLLSSVFYNEPKYGDIVVISKQAYKNGEPIIKRVIATEGQVVHIDFVSGVVSVDGVALDEPYTNSPTNTFEGVEFPQTVPEGCVFVLGDNRNLSMDSRSPVIGMIDKREILGKALVIAFPGINENVGKRDYTRIGVLW